jgi:hypothetical protein
VRWPLRLPARRGLVAPQVVGLFRDGKAPTAIRAQYLLDSITFLTAPLTHKTIVMQSLCTLFFKETCSPASRYYRYTFTDTGESDWWRRQPVPGATPKLFLPRDTSAGVSARRTPPHRAWMLLLSVCGTAMSVISVQAAARTGPASSRVYWVLIMLVLSSWKSLFLYPTTHLTVTR